VVVLDHRPHVGKGVPGCGHVEAGRPLALRLEADAEAEPVIGHLDLRRGRADPGLANEPFAPIAEHEPAV
jgi:hypothetical protein